MGPGGSSPSSAAPVVAAEDLDAVLHAPGRHLVLHVRADSLGGHEVVHPIGQDVTVGVDPCEGSLGDLQPLLVGLDNLDGVLGPGGELVELSLNQLVGPVLVLRDHSSEVGHTLEVPSERLDPLLRAGLVRHDPGFHLRTPVRELGVVELAHLLLSVVEPVLHLRDRMLIGNVDTVEARAKVVDRGVHVLLVVINLLELHHQLLVEPSDPGLCVGVVVWLRDHTHPVHLVGPPDRRVERMDRVRIIRLCCSTFSTCCRCSGRILQGRGQTATSRHREICYREICCTYDFRYHADFVVTNAKT